MSSFRLYARIACWFLNQGEGALLATLSAGQVFILVYLASTLTACMVTLWSIGRELGWRYAGLVAGRQGLTAVMSAVVLATALTFFTTFI